MDILWRASVAVRRGMEENQGLSVISFATNVWGFIYSALP